MPENTFRLELDEKRVKMLLEILQWAGTYCPVEGIAEDLDSDRVKGLYDDIQKELRAQRPAPGQGPK